MTDVANLGFAFNAGPITQATAALDKLTTSAGKTESAVRNASGAVAKGSLDWRNLGFQVNDVATMLASGSSPFQVMATQGGQVYQVLSAGPGGVAGSLKQIIEYTKGLITPARLAAGGLLAIGAAGAASYSSWRDSQSKITMALMGIGRVSGATVDEVNQIAVAAASTSNISRSAAMDIAAALVQTGKVSRDQLGSAIAVTNNYAKVLGVDAPEAAEALAKALANPVKGADALNERLGFLDYRTQTLIKSLVDQNRVSEAQAVIIKGVGDATKGASDNAGFLWRAWTAVYNAVSNGASAVGKAIDEATGGGSRETQLQNLQERLAELQALSRRGLLGTEIGAPVGEIKRVTDEIARLKAEIEGVARTSEQAKINLQSMTIGPVIDRFLPERAARRSLQDSARVTGAFREDPVAQQATGHSQGEADLAHRRNVEAERSLLTQIERTQQLSDVQMRAITARSPGERASVAYQQTMISLAGQTISLEEKRAAAAKVAAVVEAQARQQLAEAGRERIRAAEESTNAARMEIATIGQTTEQATLLRLNWQAYADLRREAERNNTEFDYAQYDRLKMINAETARQTGLAENLREAHGMFRGLFSDFGSALRNANSELSTTQKLLEAAQTAGMNFLSRMSDKLMQMAADQLWSAAFGGGGGMGGGGGILGSLFGGGTGFLNTPGGFSGAFPMPLAGGGHVRGPGSATSDSIPAWLSNGEFVVNARATAANRGLLERINAGALRMAEGGIAMAPGGGVVGNAQEFKLA